MNAKVFVFIRKFSFSTNRHQENTRNTLIFVSRRLIWTVRLLAEKLDKNEGDAAHFLYGKRVKGACRMVRGTARRNIPTKRSLKSAVRRGSASGSIAGRWTWRDRKLQAVFALFGSW